MLRVSLEEAKPRLLDLINAVLKGEKVFIIKDLQEAVQLVPAVPLVPASSGVRRG